MRRRCPTPAARALDQPRRDGRQGKQEPPWRQPWITMIQGYCRRRPNLSKRLSATDISALASMKNVAKCDTWCELQNPANHRVFERKLRPRPSGRGHACLGVTPSTLPSPLGGQTRMRRLAPRAARCGRPKCEPSRVAGHDGWWCDSYASRMSCARATVGDEPPRTPLPLRRAHHTARAPRTATPGQAGPPAEFKHINKRRRRNLQGFP